MPLSSTRREAGSSWWFIDSAPGEWMPELIQDLREGKEYTNTNTNISNNSDTLHYDSY